MKETIKHIIKQVNKILLNLEPVFRLIEVIIIGVCGVFISYNSNLIAKSQYKLDLAASQPVFSVQDYFGVNSKGKENANETIIVNVLSGTADNIKISAITCIEATVINPATLDTTKKNIEIFDYYFVKERVGENTGCIEILHDENNLDSYSKLFSDVVKDSEDTIEYIDKSTIVKISYQDILSDEYTEYYRVNGTDTIHLDRENGKKIYDEYCNSDSHLSVTELSIDKLQKILGE